MAQMLEMSGFCRIGDASDAAAIFAPHLAHVTHERLAVAHLGANQTLLGVMIACDGTRSHVDPPVRAMIVDALASNATAIIIAHNHPSGSPLPSAADRDTTRLLCRTLKPLGIALQDHLIFAGQQWTSFRGLGLM